MASCILVALRLRMFESMVLKYICIILKGMKKEEADENCKSGAS